MPDPASYPEHSMNRTESSFSAAGAATAHATIGSSIVIKGEVSGTEPLFIDGTVEGSIHIPDHRVTVGRGSRVAADVRAHDVVVMGSVKGNIYAADLLDIRADSFIEGQMVAKRIRIDDGAVLKGSVEVHSSNHKVEEFEVAGSPKPIVQSAPVKTDAGPAKEPSAPKKESGSAVAAPHAARRVSGSSTLLELEK
jgi:cytoskeletal protein CcmA (bactofilin family)